jgi:hypothetical protein
MLAAFSICLYGMHHFIAAVIALLGMNVPIFTSAHGVSPCSTLLGQRCCGRHDAIPCTVFSTKSNAGKLMCARLQTTNRRKRTRALNNTIMHVNAFRLLPHDPGQKVRVENNLLR